MKTRTVRIRRSSWLSTWKIRWLPVSALLALLVAASAAPASADGPRLCKGVCAIAIVPVAPGPSEPFGITSGPRGSVWFSEDNAIGRVDQQGEITTYPVPTAGARVGWMTTDTSGAVWFAERFSGKIGRIMPNGAFTEFSLPARTALPQGIVFAPDGNIYVTEQGANAIARVNPTTGEAIDFPITSGSCCPQSGVLGPDAAIWFVERASARIGRMTLDGNFTEYPLAHGSVPNRIVVGPDDALWFSELAGGKLGRITTGGVLNEFPIAGGPVGITVGKDGQLYVDLFLGRGVDRVNLQGQLTGHWDLPGAVGPLLISTGFGLDIWVTDSLGGKLYRVTPYDVGRP